MVFDQRNTNSDRAPTAAQTRGMRSAVLCQCFGVVAFLSFSSGLMLVYLTFQQISSTRTVLYLSIPNAFMFFSILLAYQADRRGKKRMGMLGAWVQVAGFACITGAAFLARPLSEVVTVMGIAVFSLGFVMFLSSWLALLNPVVPEHMRGRFFGWLRVAWQLVAIVFTIGCAVFLSKDASQGSYQVVLGAIAVSLAVRIAFYRRIPEMGGTDDGSLGLVAALKKVMLVPDYLPFCSYVFLLSLATSGAPMLFGLIEKKVLDLTDGLVVALGAMGMVGSVFGFWLGGKAVDRLGTKPVFLTCHVGFGMVLLAFPAREFVPIPVVVALGVLHLLLGFVLAGLSIAITTEILALIPQENASLATSLYNSLKMGGVALSGGLIAAVLGLNVLSPSWSLGASMLSEYDTILMFSAAGVILLTVTLGLVPSVMGKARWVPGA